MPARTLNTIRILLIQARSSPAMRTQERECFAERCRVPAGAFTPVNVLTEPFNGLLREGFDALMIGGSGECNAYGDFDWMPALLRLVREAYTLELPTFGSCWGHQIIARALGGTVAHDPDRAEIGGIEVQLRPAAATDPLFAAYPTRFRVNAGHHDRVTRLPGEAIELAYSDSQPHQAFRIAGKPMYGTQFHSELDARRTRERLLEYRRHYDELQADASIQTILDSLLHTGVADHLMYDFLRRFVAPD